MSVRNAQNESVDKDLVKIPDIPGTPTIGTATDVGTNRAYNDGAATVTYTGSSYWGTALHTATSSPGSFTGSSTTSPITVTGLQSNTAYTFTVKGTPVPGSAAASAASAASNSITATTVPQAPTIGTATDLETGGNVSVTFTPGATGGKAVSSYTVTSSPGSITGSGSSSPITVSGLTTSTAYTFTVTATNANGTSTASSASNSVTPLSNKYILYPTNSSQGGVIKSDASNNTYFIAGSTFAKVSKTGVQQFAKNTGMDTVNDIAIASSGNIYIVGTTNLSSFERMTIQKYNSSGTLQWQKRLNGDTSHTVYGTGITLDSSENVYAVGFRITTVSLPIACKIDSSGTFQWSKVYANTEFSVPAGSSVVYDSGSNSIIFAVQSSTGGTYRCGLLKVSASTGAFTSSVGLHTSASRSFENTIYVSTDNAGNIYSLGAHFLGSDTYAWPIWKHSASTLSQTWARAARYSSAFNSYPTGLTVDSSGVAYAVGQSGNNQSAELFVWNNDGSTNYSSQLNLTGSTARIFTDATADSASKLALLFWSNSETYSDGILKVSADGSDTTMSGTPFSLTTTSIPTDYSNSTTSFSIGTLSDATYGSSADSSLTVTDNTDVRNTLYYS